MADSARFPAPDAASNAAGNLDGNNAGNPAAIPAVNPALNPYAAPSAPVNDRPEAGSDQGEFIESGRIVPAGNGWHWYRRGWQLFRAQTGLWIGVGLMFFLLTTAIQIIPILGFMAGFFLTPLLLGGIMVCCHAIDRGGRMRFGDLFAGFSRNPGQLVALAVFEILGIVLIGLVTVALLGFSFDLPDPSAYGFRFLLAMLVALVLLAIYLSAVWFAPALIVLNDLSAWNALKASFNVSLRNWLPFLVFALVGLVIAIPVTLIFSGVIGAVTATAIGAGAGFGSVMVGMLVLIVPLMLLFAGTLGPIVFGTIYASYRDIFYRAG